MEVNVSDLEANVTFEQIASALNLNVSNTTNDSETQKVFDLYDDYRARERDLLVVYGLVSYVLGTLIILSNLTVVISSGLILKKGQQPKSTYLLLGNVSLADTIIGFSLIFSNMINNTDSSHPMCIFQIGMIVCPTMVSIFSVGFIAIDRYIYILHGLYYQRWINATRVRIGIVIIWLVGLTLGFLPAFGWVNKADHSTICLYSSVFPTELIIFNSLISLVPTILVAVLYSFILRRALKSHNDIQTDKTLGTISEESGTPKLRATRGNLNNNQILFSQQEDKSIIKCASATSFETKKSTLDTKSKSNNDIQIVNNVSDVANNSENIQDRNSVDLEISVCTIDSDATASNSSVNQCNAKCCFKRFKNTFKHKKNEVCKCRAVAVVMLTTGSFLLTWVPFFFIMMGYVIYCQNIYASETCVHFRDAVVGPLTMLALANSIVNPLIYAWWHKGFQRAVKTYLKRYCVKEKLKAAFRKK